jgi:hypothetical protein
MYAEHASSSKADAKLLLLQKTNFVTSNHTGQRPVADRSAARPERSAKGATASGQNNGGAERDRTADPLLAKQMLSQLSYSPRLRPSATARQARYPHDRTFRNTTASTPKPGLPSRSP